MGNIFLLFLNILCINFICCIIRNIGNLFRHILTSVGYVGVLLYMSWKLSIVILICVPIFIISNNYFGTSTKKMVKKY